MSTTMPSAAIDPKSFKTFAEFYPCPQYSFIGDWAM
jgi:hypothetical protein